MLLQQLLTLPIYRNARIVAGQSGLSGSQVLSVNIMDAPDIIHYLKPHELLLTTGYAMKDHPDALLALVTNMAEVGCAGIAIKTKRFLEEVPEAIVRQADELGFPIIELSLDHSIGELANQSLSHILEKRTDELHYALSTHKQLSEMIMKGQSTPEIVDALASLIGAPVLLLDTELKLVHGCPQLASLKPEAEYWLEAIAAACPAAAPDGFTELSLPLPGSHEAAAIAHLLPIYTLQLEGYLATLAERPGRDQALTRHAMEQAANVIGLELVKKQAVQEKSRRYKNEFFSDFVDGLIASEQELLHRSKHYGLLHHPVYVCALAKRDPRRGGVETGVPQPPGGPLISDRDRYYQLLKSEFTELQLPFVLFTKNDTFCYLIALPAPTQNGSEEERSLVPQLRAMVHRMQSSYEMPVSVGVGNPVSKLTDIPLSYKEASKALAQGYEAGKRLFVQPYREKDLTNLLRLLPREEMKEYYEQTFKELMQLEDKERGELMKTLHMFYETHCQLAETAKRLYVHRNTVTYRLDKCQRLTGRELRRRRKPAFPHRLRHGGVAGAGCRP
ncbi:PucR family transcriptional regulator [Paenibacillus sp. 1P07SE]|uniref:PucR family transcriptional regulator n=1 Tax=Paenibacillus sp. 1P07SE TaxID=3132209 RepID=UPI0039A6EB81